MRRNLKTLVVRYQQQGLRSFVGVLVVIAVAGIGVYVLVISHAASPYGSQEAANGSVTAPATIKTDATASGGKSVTFNAPAAKDVDVYAFTSASNPASVISQLKSSPYQPAGIAWIVGWSDIEPNAAGNNQWSWSEIDNALAAASSSGYKSILIIEPGEHEPGWLTSGPNAVPTIQVNSDGPYDKGNSYTIANPVTSQYLTQLQSLITALGQRYDGNSEIAMVQSTGLGLQGEMELGESQCVWPTTDGITATTLLSGWEQAVDDWRSAFPRTPTGLAIDNVPCSTDTIVPNLMEYLKKYGGMQWFQQNGLTSKEYGATTGYPAVLSGASMYTTVGWQMYGYGSANGNLMQAFEEARATNSSFVEVYLSDILNSANVGDLNYLTCGSASGC
jgi:hypothetical protein